MGLALPWGILAAMGILAVLAKQERNVRFLATALLLIVGGATSLRWLVREMTLVRTNVSNTTVHPVFLPEDAIKIISYLNGQPGRKVLVAPPGQPGRLTDAQGQPVVDEWASPLIPDLNSILSGFTGVYSYAGHWSETPEYPKRRGVLERFYFGEGPLEQKRALLAETKADYAVVLNPAGWEGLGVADLSSLGEMVVDGKQYRLLKLAPATDSPGTVSQ
jgi:arabinosyltransferase C